MGDTSPFSLASKNVSMMSDKLPKTLRKKCCRMSDRQLLLLSPLCMSSLSSTGCCHNFPVSEETWERAYVRWMKAKDEMRRMLKNSPRTNAKR